MSAHGIRSLLVHLDGPKRALERLQAARRLAAGQPACVCAMHAWSPLSTFLPLPGGAGLTQQLLAVDREQREATRRIFDEWAREGGRAEWSEVEGLEAERVFASQARYADFVVLGQADPDDAPAGGHAFAQDVLASSGRPGLVVPYTGTVPDAFARVAVAWKESPEAARALAAALPVLREAREVHIFAWGAAKPHPPVGRLDLPGYLKMHGIDAHWHDGGAEPSVMPADPGNLGELLLSRSMDVGADLLVMGCYGHSRAREWLFGGVTRTILRSMTVPVLMTH